MQRGLEEENADLRQQVRDRHQRASKGFMAWREDKIVRCARTWDATSA